MTAQGKTIFHWFTYRPALPVLRCKTVVTCWLNYSAGKTHLSLIYVSPCASSFALQNCGNVLSVVEGKRIINRSSENAEK